VSTAFRPSTQPARPPSARPWGRIGIIGIVGALAVGIGLAAGSFLTTRAAIIGSASAYVPPDAVMYVEVRLEPSAGQDSALRELLGRFPAIDGLNLDRPLTEGLAEMLDSAIAGGGVQVSWSDDVAPWTDGRAAVAVLELPEAAIDPAADPADMTDAPPMLVMLGVNDAAEARSSLTRILDRAGAPATATREHRGVTIHAASDEGAYAVTDDQLLVAPSPEDIVAALDTEASGATLAGREEVLAHIDALPSDWLAFGVFDLTSALGAAIDAAGSADDAAGTAMSRILQHQPMMGAFTVTATENGIAFDTAGPPASGPFAPEDVERVFSSEVPDDVLYLSEGGNLGAAMAEMIAAVKGAATADPATAEPIATVESALGADLEELVAWVGDGALAIGWDGEQAYGGLLLEMIDRDAAQRRVDQLVTFAGLAAMDPGTNVRVEETQVADTPVTTIWFVDPTMAGMAPVELTEVAVQIAVTEDRILVGIGDRFVRRVLELDAADALGATPRYADAIAAFGGPSTTGTAWLDIAGTVDAARGVLPDLGAMEEVFEWLEPFDRLVSVGQLEDGVVVQHSELFIR
jgi:hypothetical protein